MWAVLWVYCQTNFWRKVVIIIDQINNEMLLINEQSFIFNNIVLNKDKWNQQLSLNSSSITEMEIINFWFYHQIYLILTKYMIYAWNKWQMLNLPVCKYYSFILHYSFGKINIIVWTRGRGWIWFNPA